MDGQRLALLIVLWLGAATNMALIVAYATLLNIRGRVTRQLVFVACAGAAEHISLSLVLLGVHPPLLLFLVGYGTVDVIAMRWLILLFWARRGQPRPKRKVWRVDKIAKAIAAGLTAGAAMFYSAITDNVITRPEWYRIVAALVVSGVLTWLVPNAPDKPATVSLRGKVPGVPAPSVSAGTTPADYDG